MDKRTKILAGLFGVVIAYGLFTKVVYPTWIEPLVTIDDRIAERKEVRGKLEAQVEEVKKARYEYREWAGRAGGFEINNAVTEIRERLNNLLAKHKLTDVKVSPTRPSDDRKTGLWKASVTITGSGALDSAITFLRDLTELPHLCRVGNASISPASSRGRDTTINRFHLRVPVEVWVVPQQQIVGRLKPEDLVQPDFYIRHQGQEYASVWQADPFNEYVPMKVQTRPTMMVVKGNKATLEVAVEGGVGPYKYDWTPTKGLTSPATRNPMVNSSEVGRESYTVSVTDARGNEGKSSISVTVSEPAPVRDNVVRKDPKPQPPPPPPGRPISKDARMQTLTMVLMRESHGERRDEIMVNNAKTKQTSYYGVGDEFEGGELIFVRQSGGVVNWKDEYYVYPLGENLDGFVSAKDAHDYPILQRSAGRHMELMAEKAKVEQAKKKAEPPTTKSPESDPAGKANQPQQKAADPAAKVASAPETGTDASKKPVNGVVSPQKGGQTEATGPRDPATAATEQPGPQSGKQTVPASPRKQVPRKRQK